MVDVLLQVAHAQLLCALPDFALNIFQRQGAKGAKIYIACKQYYKSILSEGD
jgi:hypothetical protein